jgi:tripartite-type tricarboxylate transporter receptor subunit TctC
MKEIAMNHRFLVTRSIYMAMFRLAVDVLSRQSNSVTNALIVSLVVAVFSSVAMAESYPSRPITIIVPYTAGGPTDAVGRVLAEPMRGSLGQPILIENVGGADGSIATGRVAHARPDGYTIELGSISTHMLNGALYSLPYDVLNDFAPIAPLATSAQFLFARKTMPAKDLNELIGWLKANPNKASAGIGATSYRLMTAFFQRETGTQFTLVPYRGTAPAIQDLVAGQIDLLFSVTDTLPLARAGSIKAFAATSDARLALAPDIPTFGEMGLPALSFSGWWALFAPKGTPKEIIDRSMRSPSGHCPTLRRGLGLPILGARFSRASNRPRRHSAHYRRPKSRSGGRSSESCDSSAVGLQASM